MPKKAIIKENGPKTHRLFDISKFVIKEFLEDKELRSKITLQQVEVLRMRFGIGLDKVYTLAEVGTELCLTPERIRQIEKRQI